MRRTGFAISEGAVVEHGLGLGMPLTAGGQPHLALSIAAHASFVTESSIAMWKRTMPRVVADRE